MDKTIIINKIQSIFNETLGNLLPETNNLKIFDTPLIGFGSANDPLFLEYKKPGIIGPWYMTPTEWMEGAKTVISIFFPFSDTVKESNRNESTRTGEMWLDGRVEGQVFIGNTMQKIKEYFEASNINAVVPQADKRFKVLIAGKGFDEYPDISDNVYGSNWSERHAGFVCGLGTFGLSKGLITKKGMAGRMGSIIINTEITPDTREYTDIYEYCINCGVCTDRCLVNAISIGKGKDHPTCDKWLLNTKKLFAPRYGCGLCQTGTPCESRIP